MKRIFFIGFLLFTLQTPSIVFAQWSQVNGSALYIKCLALSGSTIYAGGVRVISSTDNGISWNDKGVSGSGVFALATIDKFIFAGTDGNSIFRSSDSGVNWKKVNNGLTNTKDRYIWGLAVNGTTLYALSQFGGAVRSTDYGENWIKSDSGLPSVSSQSTTTVHCIIQIGTNLLAGTGSGLFLSTDTGTIWSPINNDLKKTIVTSLVQSGKNIYAGSFRGVFRSIDSGINWTQINNGLTDTLVLTLALNGNTLFAGTHGGGVFLLNDTTLWTYMSKDLLDSNITALVLNDQYLFAGTSSTGIWRFPLSSLNTVKQNATSVNRLIFHPNYPNPFSTQTTISFSTDKREFIDIKIFDLLGKECAHLFSGELDAGEHSYEWNASHLPFGVYTCIIRTGDGTTVEQPIIVR